MNNTKRPFQAIVLTALAALSLSAVAAPGPADSRWDKNHPRRDQVNDRLEHQNQRIKRQVREGDLTREQGRELHQEVHAIRKQEQAMAAQHNGHITKAEQKILNQQENAVSKQIGK